MRKFLKFLVIIPSLMLVVSACGKKQVVKPSEESVKADRALSAFAQMREAYEARDLAGYAEGRIAGFQEELRRFLQHLKKRNGIIPEGGPGGRSGPGGRGR